MSAMHRKLHLLLRLAPLLLATGVFRPLGVHADPVSDWAYRPWLGWWYGGATPWYYHLDHGWWYVPDPASDSLWAWSPGAGWVWTSPSVAPFLHSLTQREWYEFGGRVGESVRYRNTRTRLWEKDWLAEPRTDLSALLEGWRAEADLPALGAVLIRGGRVAAEGMTGRRRVGHPAPATLDDPFHLGSMTKSMTALVAADLVGEGQLAWDDTLGSAFPELAGAMKPANASITLRQLLNHTSGLPGQPANWNSWFGRTDPLGAQRLEWVRMAGSVSLASTPGQAHAYSNWGYTVAGAWLERRTGQAWEDLIRARVFSRLGLRTGGFGPPRGEAPWGHSDGTHAIDPASLGSDNPPVIGPAGTVHLSVRDFATYAAFHLAGARGETDLLPATAFTSLHQPSNPAAQEAGYAFGWVVGLLPDHGAGTLLHNGSNTLFYAIALIAPERDAALVVVANRGDDAANFAVQTILLELADRFL